MILGRTSWVHVNGGITNGGVACVVVRFCELLRVLALFCAFLSVFSYQNGLQKSANFAQNSARMCTKRFHAIPPLVIPPFACHRTSVK